jgi:hypothetical protein
MIRPILEYVADVYCAVSFWLAIAFTTLTVVADRARSPA